MPKITGSFFNGVISQLRLKEDTKPKKHTNLTHYIRTTDTNIIGSRWTTNSFSWSKTIVFICK